MSTPLKVACFGFRGVGSQVDRIEEGFRALGWDTQHGGADGPIIDLVYANDSGRYQEAIEYRAMVAPRAKLILNVLDLAPHLGNRFPLSRVGWSLEHADAITTISQTVARDIKVRLEVDAHVIYNPIRAVSRHRLVDGLRNPSLALFVGRVNDPEKRAGLGAAALSILGFDWNQMVTVGRESPHYGGLYVGEVDDTQLDGFYNTADFLISPTRHAFLGLPILEAMACGCIPVVCNDLDILDEFLPADVFPEYREVTPDAPSIARFVARYVQNEGARAELSQRLEKHYALNWAEVLSPAGVARSIESVYQTL